MALEVHQESEICSSCSSDSYASCAVELDEHFPLPFGCQRFLDLKTGTIFYIKEEYRKEFCAENMSRNNKRSMPSINRQTLESSSSSSTTNRTISSRSPSPQSPASSCISSESYASSPEKMAPMVLAGCARCMMYVMLSEEDPKCPKCKNPVLIDFSHGKISKNKNKNKTN